MPLSVFQNSFTFGQNDVNVRLGKLMCCIIFTEIGGLKKGMLALEAKINQKERNGGLVFNCTVRTSISRSVASGKTEVLS